MALALPAGAHGAADPELETLLERTPADGGVAVIATLDRQVDGAHYDGRPQALLRALRQTAARTQPDLERRLAGRVRNLWLINAVAFTGTPEEIRAVAADPAVARVELDPPAVVVQSTVPTPTTATTNRGLAATRTPAARARFGLRGDGVRVGVIDTGIAAGHPALAGRVVGWRDFTAGRATPYDDHGHGTHTAGLIAAGPDGVRSVGVAPGVELVVAKAIDGTGHATGSRLLEAAQWMADPDGDPTTADQPDIVNNSWASGGSDDPWFHAVIQRWRELDIVPVFSAGNDGPAIGSISSPAQHPQVLAVGALNEDGSVADYSARGPGGWRSPAGLLVVATKPDVVAPGEELLSTAPYGYGHMSGTSMAAPLVSGLAALVRQARPDMDADAVAAAIRSGATDIGAPGVDPHSGHGRIDALRTLEAVGATPVAPTADGPTSDGPTATADDLGPETTFSSTPRPTTNTRRVVYTVTLSGGATGVRVRTNGGEWGPLLTGPSLPVVLDGDGTHTVEAQGVAADGRTDPTPARHVVRLDTRAPTLRIQHVRRGATSTVHAVARDGENPGRPVVRVQFSDGTIVRGGTARRTFAEDGPQAITVTAQDRAGNLTRRVLRLRPGGGVALRGLRLSRRSGVLRVTGRRARAVPMQATLRPVAAGSHALPGLAPVPAGTVPVARARTGAGRGRFAITLPLDTARPGPHRLELRVPGRVTVVRTVRVG